VKDAAPSDHALDLAGLPARCLHLHHGAVGQPLRQRGPRRLWPAPAL